MAGESWFMLLPARVLQMVAASREERRECDKCSPSANSTSCTLFCFTCADVPLACS